MARCRWWLHVAEPRAWLASWDVRSSSRLLFFGVAAQAVTITLLAAVFALGASQLLKPMFPLPIVMPATAFVALPIIAIVVGLLSSLVALRRAIAVDPSSAFAAAP